MPSHQWSSLDILSKIAVPITVRLPTLCFILPFAGSIAWHTMHVTYLNSTYLFHICSASWGQRRANLRVTNSPGTSRNFWSKEQSLSSNNHCWGRPQVMHAPWSRWLSPAQSQKTLPLCLTWVLWPESKLPGTIQKAGLPPEVS